MNYHPYPYSYPYPYPMSVPIYDDKNYDFWNTSYVNDYYSDYYTNAIPLKDYGSKPFVVNINKAAKQNRTFRTALWTGKHLQVTLMSIKVGEDIGLEVHPNVDQFLRIEQGHGVVRMGDTKNNLYFKKRVADDDAIMVPAGTWHNVINTGNKPLKLYSIYAPPNHPFGTVHKTKADAMREEHDHH
ncbi:cupin domain-containing protein [Shimazuella sp. AN120528]|uniref:cupin domain-containing protein n=1 Tax=Shimazuella soli TaxID=1892854 RepID=UPI001F0FAC9B|nr:cupin domain-containing protein [Shimazuella soli]MCH5586184.1 cupin domain-containing protein [Shimazuella soli]